MNRSVTSAPKKVIHTELAPGLHRFTEGCNVYVICDEHESIAIDFGSGRWLETAASLKLPPIRRVYLTHHHPDQCEGLLNVAPGTFEIHAPSGEQLLYDSTHLSQMAKVAGGPMWFPTESYSTLPRGLPNGMLIHDLQGFDDHFWLTRRLRFIHTPGHGCHAISIIVDHNDKQLIFCGDAAHANATIHQPYHLEWDHWTASGAIAAQQGVERLASLGMDMLLPSHGPVVGLAADDKPRAMLQTLAKKLGKFIQAKGSVCAGEKDHYLSPLGFMPGGAIQLLPNLYWFNNGGYLLLSKNNQALITDPFGDLSELDALVDHLKIKHPKLTITAQLVTHYHADHCSAADNVREKYNAPLYLHPQVAHMLARGGACDVPYLSRKPILPDHLWPHEGKWQWNEYTFGIALMPGQTWWHCGFMTTINRKRVLFGGDTFQPASRWNGTGGFCSINGCRFDQGFEATAKQILQWKPHIIVTGHGTWRHYSPSYFRKAIRWSQQTQAAITALCPEGDMEKQYHLHRPVDISRH